VNVVHFLVPDGIDDPQRPSGGNVYDRRVSNGLRKGGWRLHEHAVAGSWPQPDEAAQAALADVLTQLPDRSVVLLDGLIASAAPNTLMVHTGRLRLVIVLHMPLGDGPPTNDLHTRRTHERASLSTALAIIATSVWTKEWLCEHYAIEPERIHVATPGVDASDPVAGTADGGRLLCVAAVTPLKGHDVLLAALQTVRDLPWCCTCVGSLDRDPAFVDSARRNALAAGIGDRVRFAGPLLGVDLDRAYAAADVLLLTSRRESFGMVVTEALARGIPVITTAVGGIPEALGQGTDNNVPGILSPLDDPTAFGAALRAWLVDALLRQRLRHIALERRATLQGWPSTVARIASTLATVAA
jgi:glycosyltransferase involved in cell wall biosynthesis